jgi:choline dehydrogenase-like flavoprotein
MVGFSVAVTLITPRSRGRLQLTSIDQTAKPEIDLGFYQDPADFDTLLTGTQALLDMARCEPLAGFLDTPYLPDVTNPDDQILAAHVRRWTQTMYHPAGTCAMGTDERAVVDPQLRARGVEGLRVIDASVMPSPLRGNTNAPIITIAEKGSNPAAKLNPTLSSPEGPSARRMSLLLSFGSLRVGETVGCSPEVPASCNRRDPALRRPASSAVERRAAAAGHRGT